MWILKCFQILPWNTGSLMMINIKFGWCFRDNAKNLSFLLGWFQEFFQNFSLLCRTQMLSFCCNFVSFGRAYGENLTKCLHTGNTRESSPVLHFNPNLTPIFSTSYSHGGKFWHSYNCKFGGLWNIQVFFMHRQINARELNQFKSTLCFCTVPLRKNLFLRHLLQKPFPFSVGNRNTWTKKKLIFWLDLLHAVQKESTTKPFVLNTYDTAGGWVVWEI